MKSIFTTLLQELDAGRDVVLCTIIRENGSAPRGVGAQMLVGERGLLAGTIGGGAVEKAAVELCAIHCMKGVSTLQEYDLHPTDGKDIGMVCGGSVTVHFQYISAADAVWHSLAAAVLDKLACREAATLVLHINGTNPILGDSTVAVCDDSAAILLPLPVGERAILFGAGHCSAALSPLLQTVGFRVTVMDDRVELAVPARFPGADRVICGDFSHISDYLAVTGEDYLVVMTSGHVHDLTVENQLLRGDYAYIGVIGSRAKTAAVNAKLRALGITEDALADVHTPIGTAIRAVTPEEIAVSIAGEMILHRAIRRDNAN